MMSKNRFYPYFLLVLTGLLPICSRAQLVSGPMLGPVTHRTASLWLEVDGEAKPEVVVKYWPDSAGPRAARQAERLATASPYAQQPAAFQTLQFGIHGLQPATTYSYEVWIQPAGSKGKPSDGLRRTGRFTTQTLWQWRTDAPDFSFLAGSCYYVNEPAFDRPGRVYGGSDTIFTAMAKEKAAFMFWLGDNWYLRDVDYTSRWGIWYRPHNDRAKPNLQSLLGSMSHLAIWDDHDFGPNDYGNSYPLKDESREAFRQYWLNPSYGENGQGIYSRYQYNDVDFFLLDDRTWRSFDDLPDSIGGQPNPNKRMLGKQQMEWLKNELRYSRINPHISFRIIAVGSQVMNPASPFDKMADFPIEYHELMNFIRDEKIPGIVFINGDRHHSEVLRVNHPGMYPMYEITCSPLTSGTHEFGASEKNNPWRVVGVDKLHNYTRLSISGPKRQRQLKVDYLGADGKKLAEWQVSETELK